MTHLDRFSTNDTSWTVTDPAKSIDHEPGDKYYTGYRCDTTDPPDAEWLNQVDRDWATVEEELVMPTGQSRKNIKSHQRKRSKNRRRNKAARKARKRG